MRVMDPEAMLSWASWAEFPFVDRALRGEYLSQAAIEAELAPTDLAEFESFGVRVFTALGVEWRMPDMTGSVVSRRSPAFARDLEAFLRKYRPGVLQPSPTPC